MVATSEYRSMRLILSAAICLISAGALAQSAGTPKLGPDAVPIFDNLDYLRSTPATDYWLLVNFHAKQPTPNGSSVAAAVMAVNALLGAPRFAEDQVLDETGLMAQVANQKWSSDIGLSGKGATFGEFGTYLRESLNAVGLEAASVAATAPANAEPASLDAFRAELSANEASGKNIMLAYFDRAVVTGDRGGAHISPIGAYDEAKDLVLIMDVDRDWYVPYWTPATTLLVALVRPAASGPLAGERGGYFLVTRP
jgi:hypothetical protein